MIIDWLRRRKQQARAKSPRVHTWLIMSHAVVTGTEKPLSVIIMDTGRMKYDMSQQQRFCKNDVKSVDTAETAY